MMTNNYVQLLKDPHISALELLNRAHEKRKEYFGNKVTIHIINNAKNGHCPEDCGYCAQAKSSDSDIVQYTKKDEEETLLEAKKAYEAGAHRYCMVFSGRGPREKTVRDLASTIKKIKENYNLEVCVSAGLLDDKGAEILAEAGLDRYNHNLNTSENNYSAICSTHTFKDRMETLKSANSAGLNLCSGIIVGLGESPEELVDIAFQLRDLNVASVPVNFHIPIPGTPMAVGNPLTPMYCLKILSVFRLIHPTAELRMAAGREMHLRSLQVMGLYAANSLFMQGYLNTTGDDNFQTLQMIQDAGFEIESDIPIEELIAGQPLKKNASGVEVELKTEVQLRPSLQNA